MALSTCPLLRSNCLVNGPMSFKHRNAQAWLFKAGISVVSMANLPSANCCPNNFGNTNTAHDSMATLPHASPMGPNSLPSSSYGMATHRLGARASGVQRLPDLSTNVDPISASSSALTARCCARGREHMITRISKLLHRTQRGDELHEFELEAISLLNFVQYDAVEAIFSTSNNASAPNQGRGPSVVEQISSNRKSKSARIQHRVRKKPLHSNLKSAPPIGRPISSTSRWQSTRISTSTHSQCLQAIREWQNR